MIYSHVRPVTFQGQPAHLRVIRNNGYCWAGLTTEDDSRYDVVLPDDQDQYDQCDEDALDAFEAVLGDPSAVELIEKGAR